MRPPFEIAAIDHVVLIVDGLDAAIVWYREILGATVESELRAYGMAQLRCGASMIDLVDASSNEGAWARPATSGGRNVDHICIEIGPVSKAAMAEHLKGHEIRIEEEGVRGGAKGDGYSWYVRDPWDHQIEIKTYRLKR
jgi:catechol 2,3-dioxygenase-like lactoylglutathione lyase family enzyme